MNVVQSFFLREYGPFKNLEFKVEPGLTAIYGLNKNSDKTGRNTNGVGKSAAFHSLSEIIYEDPIVGERQDRVRSGSRGLQFVTARGKRILIQRTAKGKSESVEIKIDGKDQQYRTASIAKSFLKKVWPISQEEYSTYVHIDSLVPHPLVRGNSAQRKAFFTSFFGLDKIDAERKLYTAELAKLKRTRAAFDELRVQYDRLKQQLLTEEKLNQYSGLVQKYKKKLHSLQKQFQSVQETLRLVQFAEASFEQIKQLKIICQDDITEESFAKAKKDNKWEVQSFEDKLEHAQNWEQYQRDNTKYEQAVAALSKSTLVVIDNHGDEAEALAANRAKKVRDLREDVTALGDQLDEETELRDKFKPLAVSKLKKPEGDLEDLRTAQRAYKHQLEHAEQFAEGKCETCGQVVKIKDPKVLRVKVKKLEEQVHSHLEYEQYKETRQKYLDAKTRVGELQADYDTKHSRLKKLEPWVKIYRELQSLPIKPDAYKGKKLSTKIIEGCLKEVREVQSLLKYMEPHLSTVIDFLSLSKEDVRAAKASSDLNEKMNEVQNKLSQYMAKVELHNTIADQVQDMKSRLIRMRRELKDEPALKHLIQGYQDKNIKKMAVEAISQHLMALVNRYAQRIMPERFTFEFKWDTQIHILVHRHYGKKVRTSDVRKLSGAESTLFTLILVCALLAFVPPHKRCNIMILDEPTARFSPAMEDVFKNLLQILNQIVPSIVVITPKNETYEGAKAYTVVKNNGESIIVEGFPHEVQSRKTK